jgi:hypothetical protein
VAILAQRNIVPPQVPGARIMVVVEAGIGIYATNGVPIQASDFGLRVLDFVLPVCAGAGYTLAWDDANKKMKVFQQPAAAAQGQHNEVPNATDLSAIKAYFIAWGIK